MVASLKQQKEPIKFDEWLAYVGIMITEQENT